MLLLVIDMMMIFTIMWMTITYSFIERLVRRQKIIAENVRVLFIAITLGLVASAFLGVMVYYTTVAATITLAIGWIVLKDSKRW